MNPAIRATRDAAALLGIDLPALIAEVALWAPREAHTARVTADNPSGAVHPHVRRARIGSERAGDVVDGIRLDRNNYAGAAIRDAIGLPKSEIVGYQACHVWPDTCYDPRYHTVLANLVLVPGPLVSLTDHEPDVIASLKYRAFERFGWHPAEEDAPARPLNFPAFWGQTPEPVLATQRAPMSRVATGPRRGASQRDVMRRLWAETGGNEEAMVAGWVRAVEEGQVERQSNVRGMSEEEYGRRLLYNGRTMGWLPP